MFRCACQTLCLLLCACFLIVVMGCGSGGGKSSNTNDGSISIQTRVAAMQAIDAKDKELLAGDPANYDANMAAFLKGRPEFKDATVTAPGSVWAVFKDGGQVLILNNKPNEPGKSASVSRTAKRDTNLTFGLPGNKNAYFLNALGNFFDSAATELAQLAGQSGYNVMPIKASVDDLKTVHDAGIFYLEAHGGPMGENLNTGSTFCFSTSTPSPEDIFDASWSKYHSDYLSLDLVLVYAVQDKNAQGTQIKAWRWGITSKFVHDYMTFSENSLIFPNTCLSDTNAGMKAAFKSKADKNSITYMGWDNYTSAKGSNSSALYLFDRALGANSSLGTANLDPAKPVTPETPPQRPFSYTDIFQDMVARGYDKTPTVGPNGQHVIANLHISSDGTQFGQLMPSIENLIISAKNEELGMNGRFGANSEQYFKSGEAKVLLVDPNDLNGPGTELPFHALIYPGYFLTCKMPTVAEAKNKCIVVDIHGLRSNPRWLTTWTGKATYTHQEGQITQSATWRFQLRGDVTTFRTLPGEQPGAGTANGIGFLGAGAFSEGYDCQYSAVVSSPDGDTATSGPIPFSYDETQDAFSNCQVAMIYQGGQPTTTAMSFKAFKKDGIATTINGVTSTDDFRVQTSVPLQFNASTFELQSGTLQASDGGSVNLSFDSVDSIPSAQAARSASRKVKKR